MERQIKYSLIILLLFFIAGCDGDIAEEEDSKLVPNLEEYKKVELTFYIDVYPDETMQESFVSCVGDGRIDVEAYFIEDQRESVKEEATYQLTGYSCYNYGSARKCQGTVTDEEAYASRKLKSIVVSLNEDKIEEKDSYSVGFFIRELPTGDIIDVEHLCEGEGAMKGVVSDPSVMTQIVLPFALEKWDVVVKEGELFTATRTAFPLNLNYADITFETTMTTVSDWREG